MSNLQKVQNVSIPKVKASDSVVPTWRLVLKRELTDLWIGGKAFNLLLIYSVLLGIISYTYSFSPELSLVPPQEAVYEMLKNCHGLQHICRPDHRSRQLSAVSETAPPSNHSC